MLVQLFSNCKDYHIKRPLINLFASTCMWYDVCSYFMCVFGISRVESLSLNRFMCLLKKALSIDNKVCKRRLLDVQQVAYLLPSRRYLTFCVTLGHGHGIEETLWRCKQQIKWRSREATGDWCAPLWQRYWKRLSNHHLIFFQIAGSYEERV